MFCQKCRTPLQLDSSLDELNPAAYDLLIATASQSQPQKRAPPRPKNTPDADRRALYDQVSKNAGPATFKRHSGGGAMRDSSAMSFVLLSDSTVATPTASAARRNTPTRSTGGRYGNALMSGDGAGDRGGGNDGGQQLAQNMERITKLFEILSARSDVDHPVCVECTELLVEGLQERLDGATRERNAYVAFLKEAGGRRGGGGGGGGGGGDQDQENEEEAAAAKALAEARAKEAEAMAELRSLEEEKARLDVELGQLETAARALDRDEERFWRERNAFACKLAGFQDARDSVNAQYDHDARLLERLQRSNVYNDTFCISHDGTFATINGLRLGRLSTRPVDWPEINAAWGHALLLLVTVADKLRYSFQHYEPLPMGSTSRILRFEPARNPVGSTSFSGQPPPPPPAPKKHVLELFSSGDMPLGLTFLHRRFDNAMVAFLELVRQLGVFVHQQTAGTLSLPYPIDGDKIGDVSIKLGIAQDDGWTKACKLTLTCCKFLLAHASNVSSAER